MDVKREVGSAFRLYTSPVFPHHKIRGKPGRAAVSRPYVMLYYPNRGGVIEFISGGAERRELGQTGPAAELPHAVTIEFERSYHQDLHEDNLRKGDADETNNEEDSTGEDDTGEERNAEEDSGEDVRQTEE